jgi:thiamine transport system substrate-binding protein
MTAVPPQRRFRRGAAAAVAIALVLAACGGSDGPAADQTDVATTDTVTRGTATPASDTPDDTTPDGITLVAYDSFPESGTTLNEALDQFTEATGIDVDLLIAGDTGTMLSKASLTAGNPEGDVMWGIDNTYLSRAIDDGVFETYRSAGLDSIAAELIALVPNSEATPVDYGDVCVNYDIEWFRGENLPPPTSLDELADPAYADLLVVQNPATSSVGLAFLLATIDEYGIDGWRDYWSDLVDNGVEVVDGWTEAYYTRFTWAGGGPRPLVVSYGSSPPAEVIFADPPRQDAPTGVIESTCFRQVEFAGVLRGTDEPEAARALIDFLTGTAFQSELPLNLFVYPANTDVSLPVEFVEFAVIPETSRSLDPTDIEANRSEWVDQWTNLVIG